MEAVSSDRGKTIEQEQATGWTEPLKEDLLPVETVPLCHCPSGVNCPLLCLLLNQLLHEQRTAGQCSARRTHYPMAHVLMVAHTEVNYKVYSNGQ